MHLGLVGPGGLPLGGTYQGGLGAFWGIPWGVPYMKIA